MLTNQNILIGITGGIAAYKICELVRMYKKAGANVRVVVTPNALNFVSKLTLQTLSNNEVFVESFEIDEYKPEHIALTEADIFVIAPASANTIGKIANGICDNLLLSTACAFTNPILVVPAMNTNMWNNPFVQENIKKLKTNGYNILEPDSGFLACGTSGIGRMREVEEIFAKTVEILEEKNLLSNTVSTPHPSPLPRRGSFANFAGKKILITAGGTKEKIDPVRYISNSSSGKMGIALADVAYSMGAEVTLVSTFAVDKKYKNIVTETALEMEKAVKENLAQQDCVIMAAAVADYRVANYSEQKIKKGENKETTSLLADTSPQPSPQGEGAIFTLELVENPDILKEISDTPNVKIVGFCAESENLLENAKTKIRKKGCDYLVANDISRKDIGFNSDENEVYILDRNLNIHHIEKDTKQNIAIHILEKIFE